jgi:hypothetical protein
MIRHRSIPGSDLVTWSGTIKLFLFISAVLAPLIASPALAQERTSHVIVGVSAGTLGIGPEVAVRVSPALALRGNATLIGFGHSVEGDDIEYDGDLRLASIGATVDVHPFNSGFRISAGGRYNRNRIKLTAMPDSSESIDLGGTTYTGSQIGTLNGSIRVKRFAPTLTLGYAGGLTKGLKFGVDAGVMLEGKPRIRDLRATGPITAEPTFQESLDREAGNFREDIEKYDLFPIVQFSIGYAF